MRRTPPPPQPWCLITTLAFGTYRRILKVPEAYVAANRLTEHGWEVLIRESEMGEPPPPDLTMDMKLLSNPRRHADGDDA